LFLDLFYSTPLCQSTNIQNHRLLPTQLMMIFHFPFALSPLVCKPKNLAVACRCVFIANGWNKPHCNNNKATQSSVPRMLSSEMRAHCACLLIPFEPMSPWPSFFFFARFCNRTYFASTSRLCITESACVPGVLRLHNRKSMHGGVDCSRMLYVHKKLS
jgi:hypothetical protein